MVIIMKKIVFVVLLTTCLMFQSLAYAAQSRGVIVFCDDNLIVIQDLQSEWFLMGELYSYSYIETEDVVVGEMNSYGFHDFYNLKTDGSIRIYVDEIMASEQDVIRWLRENRR